MLQMWQRRPYGWPVQPTPQDGWKGLVKPHLFAAEVQEEGQEQPNDMKDSVENTNEEVVNETPQDEQETWKRSQRTLRMSRMNNSTIMKKILR